MSSLSASASIGAARPQKPSAEQVEKAQRNLAAIQALRATPAFSEFFMASMREHRDRLANDVLTKDAITAEQREQTRKIVQQFDTVVLPALEKAEQAAMAVIKALDASGGASPTR